MSGAGPVLVAAGALCISFAPALVNWVDAGPTLAAAFRTGLASLVLAPIIVATRPKEGYGLGRRGLGLIAAAGLAFAVDLFAWHRSLRYIGTGPGTILANTQVFYLSLVGILLYGERPTRRFLASVPLAFGGLVLLAGVRPAWTDPSEYGPGVLYGLLTGLAYAGYLLALQRAQRAAPALGAAGTLAGTLVCATALLVPAAAVTGELGWPGPRDLLLLGALALGPQLLGWVLIVRGMRTTSVSLVGLVLLAQPVLATVWGALFFGELLDARQLAGAAITVVAIGMGTRTSGGG